MIKAVFFDLYHTLVRYEPPREELQSEALRDLGIKVDPESLLRPLVAADEYIYGELSRLPFGKRSEEDKMAVWAQYERTLLQEAGIEFTEQLIFGLLGKMKAAEMKLVLFDDVAPALTELKDKEIILGLISNIDKDITPLLNELGLPAWLNIIVTSLDAGATKPHPEIFQEALRQAKVPPAEAMYVGDQYQVDVVGANRAGMQGVLLDRGDYFQNVSDCPRIQSLTQVMPLL